MNIKLFLKSNQDLILNITDPSNFKFKGITLNSKLKKFKIKNVKLKLYEQDKNEININLKSEKFIEKEFGHLNLMK
ncbi:hypothetical protein Q5M85_14495 [Paraclostridium bifermentans]|nr:hypothetical protein [Paraclostridium bifermentans]